MPKISWSAADDDDVLSAEDIDSAEDSFTAYAGDLPPGGVYRFFLKRSKFTEFKRGNQGFNNLLILDGSWKPAHAKYDGCPLWDRVVMTKAAAAFAKAFAAALGVTSEDLINRVVVDEDNVVTKIGRRKIDESVVLYVAVKKGQFEGEERLESSGTGYLVVEEDDQPEDDVPASKKSKPAKATAGKAGKKNRTANEDDEPPF